MDMTDGVDNKKVEQNGKPGEYGKESAPPSSPKVSTGVKVASAKPPAHRDVVTPYGVRRDNFFPGTRDVGCSAYVPRIAAYPAGGGSEAEDGRGDSNEPASPSRWNGDHRPRRGRWWRRVAACTAGFLRRLGYGPEWREVRNLLTHVVVIILAHALVRALAG